jgi:hypothetical protein
MCLFSNILKIPLRLLATYASQRAHHDESFLSENQSHSIQYSYELLGTVTHNPPLNPIFSSHKGWNSGPGGGFTLLFASSNRNQCTCGILRCSRRQHSWGCRCMCCCSSGRPTICNRLSKYLWREKLSITSSSWKLDPL